jgi:hypothetical protein
MRRIVLAGLVVFLLADFVCAQKRTTILGDAWVGEVISASDATREITLRHPDRNKMETFVGILEEGYKVKMKDGSLRELKVSEMTPGMRIRVFYKTKQQHVGGRGMKVHNIYRVDFLGSDEYTRLREALKLEPSIPVILAESGKLPTTNPLKIYVASEQPHIKDSFVEWVNRWNKEQAAKYGTIELVPDTLQSDVSLVIFWGTDETIMLLPAMIYNESSGRTHDFFPATVHIVVKEAEGLKVLWQKVTLVSHEKLEGAAAVLIGKEIEKRMKARLKK